MGVRRPADRDLRLRLLRSIFARPSPARCEDSRTDVPQGARAGGNWGYRGARKMIRGISLHCKMLCLPRNEEEPRTATLSFYHRDLPCRVWNTMCSK